MSLDLQKAQLILELRQGGVTDSRVLSALEQTPRERFVLPRYRDMAWDNRPLPIGHDQTISQPEVVGLMTQLLALEPSHSVLEIGTGCGYQTAILARLANWVSTIERIRALMEKAVVLLAELGVLNVSTRVADGTAGWPRRAPFDRIIVTAAAPEVPEPLLDQLADDGTMVVPVGEAGGDQKLVTVHKRKGKVTTDEFGLVRFVPMVSGTLS